MTACRPVQGTSGAKKIARMGMNVRMVPAPAMTPSETAPAAHAGAAASRSVTLKDATTIHDCDRPSGVQPAGQEPSRVAGR